LINFVKVQINFDADFIPSGTVKIELDAQLSDGPEYFTLFEGVLPSLPLFEISETVTSSGPLDSLVTAPPSKSIKVEGIWKLRVFDSDDNPSLAFVDPLNVGPDPDAYSIRLSLGCVSVTNGLSVPGTVGDPHFTTFGNAHYDFQGACDLVTVQNPGYKNGKGMHIHARTTNFGSWSATTSAAVKIGDDVLEVHGEDLALINGVEYPVPVIEGSEFNFPMTIGDYSLTVQILGPHTRRHIIHMGDGEKIFINNFKEFVDIEFLGVKAEDYDGAVGMLGAFSEGGAMVGRDGKTIFVDADAFGSEWQVSPTDPQLFHIIDGPQYPAKCMMPEKPTAEQRHLRAMAKLVTEEDAKKACAGASRMENCIADVFGSDNLEMANIYTMGSL
jgi:hypothetical protein